MNDEDTGLATEPHPNDFAAELIRQLYADLDGVLFDDEAAADDAFALVEAAAEAGRPRGSVLLILARAALAARRALVFGTPAPPEDIAEAEAAAAVGEMIPGALAQMRALGSEAGRLTRYLAIAEQSSEAIHVPLARAVHRFYAALEEEDAVTGGRALFELRSIVVHLDACASAIENAGAAPEPLRVIRPDRFHDYFMHYSALAQSPDGATGEKAVATLTEGGRISAVITADTHPLEAAAAAVRDMIQGDDTTRDHALARIRALLEFMDGLRKRPRPLVGDAVDDPAVFLSLVIAAATTPLHASGTFGHQVLAQVSRYNQMLLRKAESDAGQRH